MTEQLREVSAVADRNYVLYAECRAQRDELLKACELFTKAAQDAVRDLNRNGLACPASIAYAAEAARAAIARCKP